ncbi:protein kinase family protein [Desulfobacula toluolica]|uniref:Putative serine/threonine kinase n=1 Tax=Desulfobacula toluolica (strain DSM 7467 / Tol2) TaxID=651182 RepID=K0NJJ6_DESTT|nr:serine/threonine protein kinase [Desulfobacula toluolica]CCK81666.1 putative serine/threonine kinase [Desulfobacula toluolica Tol2]
MKQCNGCGKIVSQTITMCPVCGINNSGPLKFIDEYKIQTIIYEDRTSIVCKAAKNKDTSPVTIRIFTEKSGMDERVAKRFKNELEKLKKLPDEYFLRHYAIKKSSDGPWYKISEWMDASDWNSVFRSGILDSLPRMVTLFHNIASILDILNKNDHFMPYLILYDLMIPKEKTKNLNIKLNYKLSRFLNARATHNGPMLQKTLDCHPDIINQRAIDFRSGIWSLGKVFIELLTADSNQNINSSTVDELDSPDPELAALLNAMLSDDPDLRPQTMESVVSELFHILKRLTCSE